MRNPCRHCRLSQDNLFLIRGHRLLVARDGGRIRRARAGRAALTGAPGASAGALTVVGLLLLSGEAAGDRAAAAARLVAQVDAVDGSRPVDVVNAFDRVTVNTAVEVPLLPSLTLMSLIEKPVAVDVPT